jgi:hypothetical protein
MAAQLVSATGAGITVEMIGPETAQTLLVDHNPKNRTISPKTVDKYVRAIEAEDWPFVGDPIRFDTGGNLIDGQHRMLALVQTGATIEFLVVRGLPPESQKYMDINRTRTPADQLRIEGMKSPSAAASVAINSMRWDLDDLLAMNYKFSTFEVVNWVEEHVDQVDAAVAVAIRVRKAIGATISIAGAVYLQALRIADDEDREEFFNGLVTGAGLEDGSPILTVREAISRAKRDGYLHRSTELYYLVRAWNAWRADASLSKIQLPKGGDLTMRHMIMK